MYHSFEGHLFLSCRVTGLKIELLGETSIASTISYLDNAFVYIGSSYGDSQVLRSITIFFIVFVNMYFQKLHFRFILFNNIDSPYIVLIKWIFLVLDMTNDYVDLTWLIIEAQASLIPSML